MSHVLPACARLPLRFDPEALRQAAMALPEGVWMPHFNSGYHQGDWSGVALLAHEDAPLPLVAGSGAVRPTEHCNAFWQEQLQRFATERRGARLLRLGPGGCIREHRDDDLGLPDADRRLHIPIVTDDQVDFLLDGQRVPMQPGECWFMDLSRPHRVENHGGSMRIHLVLDCRPSPWLDAQIGAGLADTPPCGPSRGSLALAGFRDWLQREPAWEAKLAALEQADAFEEQVLALAATSGHAFSREDLRAAMAQARRDWRRQWLA